MEEAGMDWAILMYDVYNNWRRLLGEWVISGETLKNGLANVLQMFVQTFRYLQELLRQIPNSVLYYFLFLVITFFLLLIDAFSRYKGVKWSLSHQVPPQESVEEVGKMADVGWSILMAELYSSWRSLLGEWIPTTEALQIGLLNAAEMFSENLKNGFANALEMFVQPFRYLQELLGQVPNSIFYYFLFLIITFILLLVDAFSRYKGVKWSLSHPVPPQVKEEMSKFILTREQIDRSMSLFSGEVDKGLDPATKESSTVKCFTTYVQDLPTGTEKGNFLGLDLGGSNFRVLMITLDGRYFNMKSEVYVIANEIMSGSGEVLFDYIAECLYKFAHKNGVENSNLPLGFTFSFPLKQVGLKVGILQRWSKGFSCSGVIDQDVVVLLKKAIDKRGDLMVDMIAVLNDTTGTLMSCAWKNPNTKIGLILGTGTNACYVERIENIPGFDGDTKKPFVLVNTEWGAFGDKGELEFIKTDADRDVDSRTINPGKQLHEKLISGMYLGEIVRVIIVKLVKDKVLLEGTLTNEIQEEFSFDTQNISNIESEKRGTFRKCRALLKKYGYESASDDDCHSIRYVCECVSMRAAHLASAGLASLVNRMAYTDPTIGVDGTLYRLHPHLKDHMVRKMVELIQPQVMEFTLMLSSDGSGRGAALVAASVASHR